MIRKLRFTSYAVQNAAKHSLGNQLKILSFHQKRQGRQLLDEERKHDEQYEKGTSQYTNTRQILLDVGVIGIELNGRGGSGRSSHAGWSFAFLNLVFISHFISPSNLFI